MTPEGKVKKNIKAYLDTLERIWVYSPVQMGYGVVGIPDLIGCRDGRLFAVEAKAPGKRGTATPLQKLTLALIGAAGGLTCIAECVQDVKDMFDDAGTWGHKASGYEPPKPGAGDDRDPDGPYF